MKTSDSSFKFLNKLDYSRNGVACSLDDDVLEGLISLLEETSDVLDILSKSSVSSRDLDLISRLLFR